MPAFADAYVSSCPRSSRLSAAFAYAGCSGDVVSCGGDGINGLCEACNSMLGPVGVVRGELGTGGTRDTLCSGPVSVSDAAVVTLCSGGIEKNRRVWYDGR